MKKFYFLFVLFFFIALIGLVILIKNLSQMTVIQGDDFHYILEPGATAQTFVADIHRLSGFRFPILLKVFIRWKNVGKHLLAGEYIFPHGSTIRSVVDRVTTGNVVYHPLTIIDGWRFEKVLSVLENTPFIQHALSGLNPHEVALKLNIPMLTPEGLIAPNTYYYTWGASDAEILQMAYQSMVNYLSRNWFDRDQDLPYQEPYQVLIVASILEKEARLSSERRLIAGIIMNRLRKKMRLQMDSTVIYGLGDRYTGHLSYADMQDPSPYNTYINFGLPPTPIAIPSFDAISAALHPTKTDDLYFVSKNDGTHEFSRTLAEQNIAVKQYQL